MGKPLKPEMSVHTWRCKQARQLNLLLRLPLQLHSSPSSQAQSPALPPYNSHGSCSSRDCLLSSSSSSGVISRESCWRLGWLGQLQHALLSSCGL